VLLGKSSVGLVGFVAAAYHYRWAIESMNDNFYGSGLFEGDWHILKDQVLAAAYGALIEINVPEHLIGHVVTQHLNDFLKGNKKSLEKAMRDLVPMCPDQAFINLAKS